MKLNLTVTHGKAIQNIEFPIGDGNRTFKWLGLAAAQRFSMQSPQGHLRHREQRHVTLVSHQIMPSDVYSKECSFYHPEYLLKDHLKDKQQVNVDLVCKMPIDTRGIPKLSKWSFVAFNLSEEKREERESELILRFVKDWNNNIRNVP
mmetsp:Transcript_52773/g.78222  ORF Transcript_52773/g.78222 Transcript_52773/m.78222 type:complete len:148 (+) Transcript_52773:69-512(+)